MESVDEKAKWSFLLRGLRKHFPASHPVDVRRCCIKECFGVVRFHDDKFYVRICNTMLSFYQRDALVHEWAHVIADDWMGEDEGKHHSKAWGIAYATIYSSWLADFKEKTK